MNAPTYCEEFLFQWGVGHPNYLFQLARPLEKYQLSVFRPIQEWSMQGESIFETVHASNKNAIIPVNWVDETGQNHLWLEKEKLNVKLQNDEQVSWDIDLPEDATKITFKTAIKVDNLKGNGQEIAVKVFIRSGLHRTPVLVYQVTTISENWMPISIDMSKFKGERVILILESSEYLQGGGNNVDSSVQFQFPVLEINTPINKQAEVEPIVKPGNVDHLTEDFLSENQLTLAPLPGLADWKVKGFTRIDSHTLEWVDNEVKFVELQSPISLCLGDYTHFYFQMSLPASFLPRYVQVFFLSGDQEVFTDQHSFRVPLVSDGYLHTYTLNLELLNFPKSQVLKNIRLAPISLQGNEKRGQFFMTGMGFVKKNGSISCEK
jgi:hypothetical protein